MSEPTLPTESTDEEYADYSWAVNTFGKYSSTVNLQIAFHNCPMLIEIFNIHLPRLINSFKLVYLIFEPKFTTETCLTTFVKATKSEDSICVNRIIASYLSCFKPGNIILLVRLFDREKFQKVLNGNFIDVQFVECKRSISIVEGF